MPVKITLPKNLELKIPQQETEEKIKEILSNVKIFRELPPNKEMATPREPIRAEPKSPKTFGDRTLRFK